jgi:hypothetical protein
MFSKKAWEYAYWTIQKYKTSIFRVEDTHVLFDNFCSASWCTGPTNVPSLVLVTEKHYEALISEKLKSRKCKNLLIVKKLQTACTHWRIIPSINKYKCYCSLASVLPTICPKILKYSYNHGPYISYLSTQNLQLQDKLVALHKGGYKLLAQKIRNGYHSR